MLVRAFLNQKTWADHVTGHHDPVGPGVRSAARFRNVKNS